MRNKKIIKKQFKQKLEAIKKELQVKQTKELLKEYYNILVYCFKNDFADLIVNKVNKKDIKNCIAEGFSEEEAINGYGLFKNPKILNGALHIEKIDIVNKFNGDLEASAYAEVFNNFNFIDNLPDKVSAENLLYKYINTPENRKIIY